MALTAKQAAFVREYLIDLNATQAAIRAGYSPKTAKAIGCENLTKPDIQTSIAAQQKGREERTNATSDEVLREINRMAMIDPLDYISVKGPDDLRNLSETARRAIVGWKWDRQGRFVIEFAKQSAVEMLARHHSLFNDKLKIDANVKGSVSYKANLPTRS